MSIESPILWAHRGFDGGLVTSVPAHAVDPDCSPDAENFDPSVWFSLRKRKGYTSFTGTHGAPTGTRIRGLFWTTFENGTIKGLAKEGTAVYDISAGNWATTIAGHPALSDADEVHFAMFGNVVIMTSEEAAPIAPQKWTGGAFSNLGGSPPAAKFVTVHKGRLVLAHTATDPSRLYFSAKNNPEGWDSAGAFKDNATDMFVHPGDGMHINGIVSDGEVLYVSKMAPGSSEGAIYAILGTGPADFQPPRRIAYFGAASQRALTFTHTYAVAAGKKGVWGLRVGEPQVRLSVSIQGSLDALSASDIGSMCAAPYKDQIWVAHDTGGSTKAHVVDTFFQRWSRYSNIPVRIFAVHPDGSLYGASNSSTIRVFKLDNGNDDVGTAVTMYWNTPNLDMGAWFRQKRTIRNLAHVKSQAVTWTFSRYVDDVLQTGTPTFSGATDGPVHRLVGVGTDKYGRFLRYRLEESAAALQGELYGLEAEAEFEGATQRTK